MRHDLQLVTSDASGRRPLVAIVADGSTGYGRAVVRGAMRHANIKRRWLIHQELMPQHVYVKRWPVFAGAIIAGVSDAIASDISSRSRHTVLCTGSGDPKRFPIASLDDYAVGKMAAEHLLDCRLTRFAYFGLSAFGTSQNRYRGFRDTVEQAGHACGEAGVGWIRPGDAMEARRLSQVVAWLKQIPKPVGIMAVDDSSASGLASACVEAGVGVPDEVAIIGVNNDDLLCESTWPPISSIEGDYSRVGYAAAAMLDRLMSGERLRGPDRVVRFPPQGVIRRQSTDMLAINDANILSAIRFIRQHACQGCTVPDVLRQVPVTRRWLERHFATLIGRSPYEEILRVRIEMAKRLLLQPELRLETVSEQCGFAVLQQFRRAFGHATGTTPGAYRKTQLHAKH